MRFAVTWNRWALLADSIWELAGSWLARTLKGTSLAHVWCVLECVLTGQCTVVRVWLANAHVGFALAGAICTTAIFASEVVLRDMHTAISSLDCEFADIAVSRAATLAIAVLDWAIRLRRFEITAHRVISVRLQALVGTALAFTIWFLGVWCTLASCAVGDCEAKEVVCADRPVHFAGSCLAPLALDTSWILVVWGSNTLELAELVTTTREG
jgi:hypothetical protein